MASDVKIAIRRDLAVQSIQASALEFAEMFGLEAPEMEPSRRWGMDFYQMRQLEEVAKFMEALKGKMIGELVVPESGEFEANIVPIEKLPHYDYDTMTVAELEELAQKQGIYDTIEGSGSGGNIIKKDLVNALMNTEKVSDGDADE